MAHEKISGLAAILGSAVADADEFVLVDKSDTSMAATGTNKRIIRSEARIALRPFEPGNFTLSMDGSTQVGLGSGFRAWRTAGFAPAYGAGLLQGGWGWFSKTGSAVTAILDKGSVPALAEYELAFAEGVWIVDHYMNYPGTTADLQRQGRWEVNHPTLGSKYPVPTPSNSTYGYGSFSVDATGLTPGTYVKAYWLPASNGGGSFNYQDFISMVRVA